jgi:hypothetical protein
MVNGLKDIFTSPEPSRGSMKTGLWAKKGD